VVRFPAKMFFSSPNCPDRLLGTLQSVPEGKSAGIENSLSYRMNGAIYALPCIETALLLIYYIKYRLINQTKTDSNKAGNVRTTEHSVAFA
jgi:hypothetical protein